MSEAPKPPWTTQATPAASRGVSEFHRTQRNLPHWEDPGSTYFITWTTIRQLVLKTEERTVTLNSIRHWDDDRWIIYAAVVMPDHVHVLAQPLPIVDSEPVAFHSLESLIHSVKSFSAHAVNKIRGRKGSLWLDERYDRVVRDEPEFWEKWQYIRDNPVKARLSRTPEEYPWFYQRSDLYRSQFTPIGM